MKKIGLGIDYSNICTDYNTSYLDRDNTDRETTQCMKKIINWTKPFLEQLLEEFKFKIYRQTDASVLDSDEIACKRFLFYSLEKEMLLQSFILQGEFKNYDHLAEWEGETAETLLIKNDDEGEGIYLYTNENSKVHKYLLETLKDFSLEEIDFNAK